MARAERGGGSKGSAPPPAVERLPTHLRGSRTGSCKLGMPIGHPCITQLMPTKDYYNGRKCCFYNHRRDNKGFVPLLNCARILQVHSVKGNGGHLTASCTLLKTYIHLRPL
jgi:hypothetical protein